MGWGSLSTEVGPTCKRAALPEKELCEGGTDAIILCPCPTGRVPTRQSGALVVHDTQAVYYLVA